jgi:hypothetical protein
VSNCFGKFKEDGGLKLPTALYSCPNPIIWVIHLPIIFVKLKIRGKVALPLTVASGLSIGSRSKANLLLPV